MKQIEKLREYCYINKGSIFDTGYLSKTDFKDIEYSSLRKYASRLNEEGLLIKIYKGIFVTGEINKPIYKLILDHYCSNDNGIAGAEYLLYLLNIIEKKQQEKNNHY